MQPTDKIAFTALLEKVWRFNRLEVTGQDVADWIGILAAVPFQAVEAAFNRHLTDPKHGSYLPKPADIFRQLNQASADDGRPGADDAWGIMLRLVNDERETGVLTDEMRIGWTACQPILDLGDEVGARLAFRESYAREVEKARKMAVAPRWTPTLGTDPTLRQTRLREAAEAGRIGMDAVRTLLPGPTPHQIAQVAGLLTGPDASDAEARIGANLKQLAQILRNASAEAERKRTQANAAKRNDEAAKKAAIQELLEQRQRDNDSGQEAA